MKRLWLISAAVIIGTTIARTDMITGTNSANGTISGVTAGTDLKGGGTSGTVTVNLDTTTVILLQNSLQSGATFFVSSGTITTLNVGSGNLTMNDGTVQTSAGYYLIRSTFSTTVSSATSANIWVPSNLTVTITPKKTTDIVKITANAIVGNGSNASVFCDLNVYRGTGAQLLGTTGGSTFSPNTASAAYGDEAVQVFDNPLTTSATTYTVYFKNSGGAGTCTLNPGSYNAVMSAEIIGN